jgi:hypothetical protein
MFTEVNTDIALVCSLTPTELEVRGGEISLLVTHVVAVEELSDGYRFAFSGEAEQLPDLIAFVLAERTCCPFFTFELTFPSPHENTWLTIRGRDGVKEIVHDGFVAKVLEQTNVRLASTER